MRALGNAAEDSQETGERAAEVAKAGSGVIVEVEPGKVHIRPATPADGDRAMEPAQVVEVVAALRKGIPDWGIFYAYPEDTGPGKVSDPEGGLRTNIGLVAGAGQVVIQLSLGRSGGIEGWVTVRPVPPAAGLEEEVIRLASEAIAILSRAGKAIPAVLSECDPGALVVVTEGAGAPANVRVVSSYAHYGSVLLLNNVGTVAMSAAAATGFNASRKSR